MATQSGLANALYTSNVNITHEAFVAEFLKVFPAQTATIAALYWQNKARRAKFGLPPTALPAEFKDVVAAATPKAPKAPKEKAPKPVKFKKEVAAKTLLNVDEIAKIKEANLARMREVSAKLKPKNVRDYGTRVAAPEGEGVADFDPTLAREEVDAILRDERLIGICPKFVREDA